MKKLKPESLKWFGVLIVLIFLSYTVGYLTLVTRSVGETLDSTAQRAHMTVYAELKGSTSFSSWHWILFGPALKFDRHVLRRHYWSDWYESRTESGETNIIYFCDLE